MSSAWALERRVGTAQELHDLDAAPDVGPLVRWNEVEDAALVVGSAQPASSIDPAGAGSAGLTLARRRSGGGAVLLLPGTQVWVDVFLPAHAEWWCSDVDRSAWWLGDVWVAALEALHPPLVGRLAVHRSPSSDRVSGRVACFASVGPGEVLLDGRKLVGISQRRTRHWARFQCVVHLDWHPELVLASLSAPAATPQVVDALHQVATLGDAAGPLYEWSVVEALHSHLPA